VADTEPVTCPKIRILFDALAGVMLTDSPVMAVGVALVVIEKMLVFVVLTTCNTLPAGIAAAARPVAFVRTNVDGVPKFGVVSTGLVSVLLVSVSVVAFPTKVSVEVGNVSVPLFTMVAMTGLVSVLFVSVSVVVLPTSVSVATGSVRTLEPDTAGALIVTEPDVSPATKMLAILYPHLRVQCGDLRGLRVDDTLEFLNGGGQRRD